jgi:putative cardiolipin synthase
MSVSLIRLIVLSFTLFIFSESVASADTVRPITSGPEALTTLVRELSKAERSIDMMAYIFAPCDSSGKLLTKVLVNRAQANVRVRLLIDANHAATAERAAFTEYMRLNRIEVRYFNRATSLIEINSNNRIHAKFTIIDGRRYFVGSRNFQDPYFGLSSSTNFIDRDVLVEGASTREALSGFEILWQAQLTFSEPQPNGQAYQNFANSCLQTTTRDKALASFVRTQVKKPASVSFQCRDVRFYVDNPAFADNQFPDLGSEPLQDEYLSGQRWQLKQTSRNVLATFALAKINVFIENWLYIPLWRVQNTIDELRKNGVSVTVYSNFSSDAGGGADLLAHRAQTNDSNGSVKVHLISSRSGMNNSWLLTPKSASWIIHSKIAVIDSRHSVVGSYNMDPRSYHTNVESAMIAKDCPDLAKALLSDAKYLERLNRIDPCEASPASCPLNISASDRELARLMDLF